MTSSVLTVDSGVVCASRTQLPLLASVIAADPGVQPWAQWLVGDVARQTRIVRGLCTMLIEQALSHGHIDVYAGRAVAVWLDRTIPPPRIPGAGRRIAALCGPHTAVIQHRLHTLANAEPARPHVRLAVLVGDAEDASALLAHRHQRLDRAGVTAYTQATSGGQQTLLAAAGYGPSEPYQLLTGPPVRAMQRPPAGRRGHREPMWPPDIDRDRPAPAYPL